MEKKYTLIFDKVIIKQLKKAAKNNQDSKLYQRLLAFEKNITKKKYTRQDLGF